MPRNAGSVGDYALYYSDLMSRTDGFPPLALTMAAEEIEFERIFE